MRTSSSSKKPGNFHFLLIRWTFNTSMPRCFKCKFISPLYIPSSLRVRYQDNITYSPIHIILASFPAILCLLPFYQLCSNLQKVLDKVGSVTSQGQQKTLRPVVAQNAPGTHRVLEHKSQLGVADAQREECSKCPVQVCPVYPLAQWPCTHPYKLQEDFFLTCSLRSTRPTQQ